MTPYYLQDEIAEAIKAIVEDIYFEDADGKKTQMSVYKQNLPISTDDDKRKPLPYTLVRLIGGTASTNSRGVSTTRVLLLIGSMRRNPRDNTYQDTLSVIQRIIEYFSKTKSTRHFQLEGDIQWELEDESSYPYSFGGIDMLWKGQPVREENEFT